MQAELLWFHCRLDLVCKESGTDPDMVPSEKMYSNTNKINSKCQELTKYNIQKLFLHPQLKKNLFACLKKDNIVFDVLVEDDGSKTWHTRYLESPSKIESMRRELLDETTTSTSTSSIANELPHLSVASSPDSARSTSEVPTDNILVSEQRSVFRDLAEASHVHTQQHLNKMIIIAVVATATVTLLLVSLLFFCCMVYMRRDAAINDEKPLLTLTSSSYSQSMCFLFCSECKNCICRSSYF